MIKDKRFKKFLPLWRSAQTLLKKGAPSDLVHAEEVINFLLSYKGKIKMDLDIFIPVAMMHDIGHSAILPEHFRYVTGQEKILNGKLVHMLAGAKIARDILKQIGYNPKKSAEIVDMISMHDFEQLEGLGGRALYNTVNKKIFHDIDSLDRFNNKRIKKLFSLNPDKKRLKAYIKDQLKTFFYPEFQSIAAERFKTLDF